MKFNSINDFANYVKEDISKYFSDYNIAEIVVSEVNKNNTSLVGLSVHTVDTNVAPTIYIESAYEKILDGQDLNTVIEDLADAFKSHLDNPIPSFDINNITNFEKVKDNITTYVVNIDSNKDFLKNKAYIPLGDLALGFKINCNDFGFIPNGDSAIIKVTTELLDTWKIGTSDLKIIAQDNEAKSAQFKPMYAVLGEIMGFDEESAKGMFGDMPMFVLTNDSKTNAAGLIFNDFVMQNVCEKLGDNAVILPSSVHEVIILPADTLDEKSRNELLDMVISVNANEVAPEDRLSNNVYAYDAASHHFMTLDKYMSIKDISRDTVDLGKDSLVGRLNSHTAMVNDSNPSKDVKEHNVEQSL